MFSIYKIFDRNKFFFFFVVILIIPFINGFSQKKFHDKDTTNRKGWYFGGNIGAYFANKYTANYYNGTDSTGNVGQRLMYVFQYPQNYEKIKQALGGYDFAIAEMPVAMRYSPAAYVGFHARYLFTENDAFLIQANYSKLRVNDIFTLKLQVPNYSNPDGSYYKADIWGVEERVNIDFGYSRSFGLSENVYFAIEAGLNINSVRVKESKIKIEGMQFSVTDPYYAYYNIVEGGLNTGAFASANIQLWLNDVLSLEPSLTCYYSKINLGENKMYKPQYALFARLIYRY